MSYEVQPRYLGEYVSNKAAFEDVQARFLDDSLNGSGSPVEGTCYWNTRYDCLRTWNGSMWLGRPENWSGNYQAIVVTTSGSDETNDGTNSYPYATIEQAMQDVALHSGRGASVEIYLGGGTHQLPDLIEVRGQQAEPMVKFIGSSPTAETGFPVGSSGVVTIDTVVTDTRVGGRRLTLDGTDVTPLVAQAHKGKRIEITTCAADGTIVGMDGWIYDNTTTDIYVEFPMDDYGDLAAGDTLTVKEYAVTIESSSRTRGLTGSIMLLRMHLNVDTDIRLSGTETIIFEEVIYNSVASGDDTRSDPNTVLRLNNCYIKKSHDYENLLWASPLEFYNGPNVVDGYYDAGTPKATLQCAGSSTAWSFRQEIVFTHVTKVYQYSNDAITTLWEDGGANRTFIRAHECDYIFDVVAGKWGATKRRNMILPPIFGTTTYEMMVVSETAGGLTCRFLEEPDCTTGAFHNRVKIGGVERYFAPEFDVSVWGTGNGEILLAELKDWHGLASPPGQSLVGWLPGLAFDDTVDEEAVCGFEFTEDYVAGAELELELQWSSLSTSGNFIINAYAALFRPGTDQDLATPANQYPSSPVTTTLNASTSAQKIHGTTTRVALTDSSGQINSITPSRGDRGAVQVRRDADNGSDIMTGDGVLYYPMQLWMVGL